MGSEMCIRDSSGDEGNDAADNAANWAQNGGSKGVQDIDAIMLLLDNGN